ncbi:unnamed protein product [Lupinus luteus]|uniref:Uncharacterized protein n=1 Tax=Lupinus luteus TaxID=3873 RepID=A0AAV1VS99_LUPLU
MGWGIIEEEGWRKGPWIAEEDKLLIQWSTIARSLPGRTDNEIKNYWRTHFKKKAKTPSDAAEKAKTRLLKRQQFQQLQQQQNQLKQHQLQQQQLQFNSDMKNIMNMFEENVHMVPSTSQEKQQIVSNMYPNTTPYEEGYFYSMLNGNACAPTSSNEETLWDGLWNFDDVLYNFSAPSKASMHNLVAPFC